MSKQIFRAKIEAIGPSGSWSQLKIPFDVEKEWGSRARVPVTGTMNAFAFRSSIFPDGKGGHTMMVNKQMQAGAKAGPGEMVKVELEPDTTPRKRVGPADLKKALTGGAKAKAGFEALSPSNRKLYVEWITGAKRAETRAARIEKALPMLAAGKRLR